MARAIILGGVLAAFLVQNTADACMNEVLKATHEQTSLVAKAEAVLEKGDYPAAVSLAVKAFREVPMVLVAGVMVEGDDQYMRLLDRALRVTAVAEVRTNGSIDLGLSSDWYPQKMHSKPAARLEAAAKQLETLSKENPKDPYLKTRLGEALSKLPARQKEALPILTQLSKSGLMADGYGYAALAALLHQEGDTAGRDAAIKQCEAVTRKASFCSSFLRQPAGKS